MKTGYVPFVSAVDNSKPDLQLYQEAIALADMAEPLGFDSLWSLEHHFTGYAMIPSPTQFLTYFAANTKRIQLGTSVIVLPWHDPNPGRGRNRAARRDVRRAHDIRFRPRRRNR